MYILTYDERRPEDDRDRAKHVAWINNLIRIHKIYVNGINFLYKYGYITNGILDIKNTNHF
jgi:hypothetical protein